jgi:uncharacterized protein YbjT (DUF2867 family)
VTGSTGKVGRALIPHLSGHGAGLRLAVHSASDLPAGPEAERVEFDLTRPETFPPFFDGIDRVFLSTPVRPDMADLVASVVEAMDAAGVAHVVRLSTRNADPSTDTRLPRWHGEAEDVLGSGGFGLSVIRPNAFMQNYLGLAPRIRETGEIQRNESDARLSFIDVRDVGAVTAAVILSDEPPAEVSPTGPEALSNDDIARLLSEATGRSITYTDVGDDVARKGMVAGGMPDWLADVMIEFHVRRQGPGFDVVTTDVEKYTGRAPRTFAAFAAEHAEQFRS